MSWAVPTLKRISPSHTRTSNIRNNREVKSTPTPSAAIHVKLAWPKTTTKTKIQGQKTLKRYLRKLQRRPPALTRGHSQGSQVTYRTKTAHLLAREKLKVKLTASSRNHLPKPQRSNIRSSRYLHSEHKSQKTNPKNQLRMRRSDWSSKNQTKAVFPRLQANTNSPHKNISSGDRDAKKNHPSQWQKAGDRYARGVILFRRQKAGGKELWKPLSPES